MYFFPVSHDGRHIAVVFLPGDEEYYRDVISRHRYAPHDHRVAVSGMMEEDAEIRWHALLEILQEDYLGGDHD